MPVTRKPVILIVDDEPNVSKTLAWLLQDSGFNSMFCLDRETALRIATGIAADAAIVDVMLPDGDGIETALDLQKLMPGCGIVLITGNTEGLDRILHAQTKGIPFVALPKPVEIPRLLTLLNQLTAAPLKHIA